MVLQFQSDAHGHCASPFELNEELFLQNEACGISWCCCLWANDVGINEK